MIFDALGFDPFQSNAGHTAAAAVVTDVERDYYIKFSGLRGRRQHYGQTLRVVMWVTDDNGELVDVESMTLQLLNPYGTTTSYTLAAGTVQNPQTGKYTALVTIDKTGQHFVKATAVNGEMTILQEDYFSIQYSPVSERTYLDPTYDRYI